MFHLAAFYESIAASQTYTDMNAVADQTLTVDPNGFFLFPADWRAWFATAMGVGVTAARLAAPALRGLFLPEIYPVNVAATWPNRPPLQDLQASGPQFRKNDPVSIQVSTYATGTADAWGLLAVGNAKTQAPGGPSFWIPYTTTQTLVKGSWTNGPLATTQQLPYGKYTIIGMQFQCPGALAGRLVFPGQNAFRPGVAALTTYGHQYDSEMFQNGNMGVFGTFDSTVTPSLDICGLAAGAQTGTAYLQLIKVG